jgi:hypothetical protein
LVKSKEGRESKGTGEDTDGSEMESRHGIGQRISNYERLSISITGIEFLFLLLLLQYPFQGPIFLYNILYFFNVKFSAFGNGIQKR